MLLVNVWKSPDTVFFNFSSKMYNAPTVDYLLVDKNMSFMHKIEPGSLAGDGIIGKWAGIIGKIL